jgi:hypothetical protein
VDYKIIVIDIQLTFQIINVWFNTNNNFQTIKYFNYRNTSKELCFDLSLSNNEFIPDSMSSIL